jgi:hypothetical protein
MSLLIYDRTKVPVAPVVTDPIGQAASQEQAPAVVMAMAFMHTHDQTGTMKGHNNHSNQNRR